MRSVNGLRGLVAVLAAAALLAGSPVAAQSGAVAASQPAVALPRGFAAAAFTAPVAFGGGWGSVGVGVAHTSVNGDAAAALSAGLGDPADIAGLDVAVVLSSLTNKLGEGGFGEEGGLAFKLHRNLGDYTAVAFGVSAVARWGGDLFMYRNPPGHYVAFSHAVPLKGQLLMLSGGAGHNVTNKNNNGDDLFGTVAWYPVHWFSTIAEYDGYGFNAALSVAPLSRWLPLTLTVGLADLAGRHNSHPRITAMAGLGYRFGSRGD